MPSVLVPYLLTWKNGHVYVGMQVYWFQNSTQNYLVIYQILIVMATSNYIIVWKSIIYVKLIGKWKRHKFKFQSLDYHTGNFLPQFFSPKFRQIIFLLKNFTVNQFDKKLLQGREFVVFPHCETIDITWKNIT